MFMFRLLRRFPGLIAALACTVLAAPLAYALGMWPTLPIVGEGSFCASTVSGVTLPSGQGPYGVVPGSTQGNGASICGQTVPAGPTALTGGELVPADTELANGGAPATVTIPTPLMASGAYLADVEPITITTQTIPNNINTYELVTTNTLAALSLTFPSSPLNGQILRVGSVKTITAFTPLANTTVNSGQLITGTLPTALTPSATAAVGYAWIYDGPISTWLRIQ